MFSLLSVLPPGFKHAKDFFKEGGDQLFSMSPEGRTMSNGLNLQQRRFRLCIRKLYIYKDN